MMRPASELGPFNTLYERMAREQVLQRDHDAYVAYSLIQHINAGDFSKFDRHMSNEIRRPLFNHKGKPSLFIYMIEGMHGVGKTSTLSTLATTFNLEVIEEAFDACLEEARKTQLVLPGALASARSPESRSLMREAGAQLEDYVTFQAEIIWQRRRYRRMKKEIKECAEFKQSKILYCDRSIFTSFAYDDDPNHRAFFLLQGALYLQRLIAVAEKYDVCLHGLVHLFAIDSKGYLGWRQRIRDRLTREPWRRSLNELDEYRNTRIWNRFQSLPWGLRLTSYIRDSKHLAFSIGVQSAIFAKSLGTVEMAAFFMDNTYRVLDGQHDPIEGEISRSFREGLETIFTHTIPQVVELVLGAGQEISESEKGQDDE